PARGAAHADRRAAAERLRTTRALRGRDALRRRRVGARDSVRERGGVQQLADGRRHAGRPRRGRVPQDRPRPLRHVARHGPRQAEGPRVPHRPPRRLQRSDARRHAERRRNGARRRRRAVHTRRHHGGASAPRTRRIIRPFPGANTMKLLVALASTLSLAAPARAQLAPPNAAGVSYGHVHLNVKDIELHKKLWVDHFGGVVVQKGPLTAIKLPNMLIAFRQAEPTGGSEGSVMDHFGFKVRNIAEVLQAWRAAGY